MATDAAERLHDKGNDGIAFTEGIPVVARGVLDPVWRSRAYGCGNGKRATR